MKKVFALFLSTVIFLGAFAQIGGASPFGTSGGSYIHCGVCGKWHYPPTCKPTPPPTPTPIDGGVGFLLVAGAAYGVKRFRARKEN